MSIDDKKAGKSTREMARRRRKSAIWIGLLGIAIVIVIGVLFQNAKAIGISGTGLLTLFFLLQILPDFIEKHVDTKFKEEKRAIHGARAEEKIGELLANLSDDFFVLNDVESPYGNIDHIVISKNGGVFLIETKSHGGKVSVVEGILLVNGKQPEKNFIIQTLQNSYWLRDKINQILGIKPWITSVIVFTNAFVSPTRPIKGVNVVNKRYLLSILLRSNRQNNLNYHIWVQKEAIANGLI